ncbi:OmpA family protein [Ferruginibacter yonginensis]|uniref:OmpA family protein n=1 Tax=Ferruginibacter yonginensis TaxID=1310416 RepID=A0ABV8QVC0_9BACT
MKLFLFIFTWAILLQTVVFGQTNSQQQNASQPKDAPINVTITDFKKNVLVHEIVVFRSQLTQKEYQGMSQDNGQFSLRLPAGDKYEIFILGFKDSTSYNVLEIPALPANASYKNPFVVDIQFQPSKTFVLEDVNFETGKADLKPESFAVLDELVAYLNRKDDERIEIGGHTDNVGKPAANILLSMERAKTVMAYLITKGISANRLTAKGYGSTVPVASNATAAGKAQNRRTEVKILE